MLCLFEGVASGAADGYARVAGTPAATLFHLGPGLGNAFANLHNARRAHSPVLNIVGDHATYHSRYDAPLQTDIASIAGALEGWYRRSRARRRRRRRRRRGDRRSRTARPAAIATLVLPADASWSPTRSIGPRRSPDGARRARVGPTTVVDPVARAAAHARARRSCSGARRCAAAASPPPRASRPRRGAGCCTRPSPPSSIAARGVLAPERLNYLGELALQQLDGRRAARARRAPPHPSASSPTRTCRRRLVPEGCEVVTLAGLDVDVPGALEALADAARRAARRRRPRRRRAAVAAPTGRAHTRTPSAPPIGALLPEGCVVVDESNTSGVGLLRGDRRRAGRTSGSRSPAARSATACPPRSARRSPQGTGASLCLESDGSMNYTPQALWTMAREGLDVTTVCCSNDSYAILNFELARVGATASGERARAMLDLTAPDARPRQRPPRASACPRRPRRRADELVVELEKALATAGPTFINARLTRG